MDISCSVMTYNVSMICMAKLIVCLLCSKTKEKKHIRIISAMYSIFSSPFFSCENFSQWIDVLIFWMTKVQLIAVMPATRGNPPVQSLVDAFCGVRGCWQPELHALSLLFLLCLPLAFKKGCPPLGSSEDLLRPMKCHSSSCMSDTLKENTTSVFVPCLC